MIMNTFDSPLPAPKSGTARTALYPGTFDPITNGHLDIIRRGLHIFEQITVVVAVNASKNPLFSLEERCGLIQECFQDLNGRLRVDYTSGLIVDYAVQHGIPTIIRGLRAISDFDYEFQLAMMNRRLAPLVDTIFLMTDFEWIYISSSGIKNAARFQANISGLVPAHVEAALKRKFS